jgi:hypothetical protein
MLVGLVFCITAGGSASSKRRDAECDTERDDQPGDTEAPGDAFDGRANNGVAGADEITEKPHPLDADGAGAAELPLAHDENLDVSADSNPRFGDRTAAKRLRYNAVRWLV